MLAHNLAGASAASHEGTPSTIHHPHPPGEAFLLLCHGSVMYLHVLGVAAPLAHPPVLPVMKFRDVKESDFRVKDFVKNFLHPARLAPASANSTYAIPPKIRGMFIFAIIPVTTVADETLVYPFHLGLKGA